MSVPTKRAPLVSAVALIAATVVAPHPAFAAPPNPVVVEIAGEQHELRPQSFTVSVWAKRDDVVRDEFGVSTAREVAVSSFGARGQRIVATAQSLIGVPYIVGGTSPSTGFMCDSFIQYVFAQYGYTLPGLVSGLMGSGYRVSREEAMAGDLVAYPGEHIGIYDGRGGIIDAPTTGRNVNQRPVWGNPVYIRIGL